MTTTQAEASRARRQGTVLAGLLAESSVLAPTVHDALSALIAQDAGFEALFLSGFGIAAASLGLPDRGLTELAFLEERTRSISGRLQVPLIVDADTGFEDPAACVRRLARAGAAAVMIEDQVPTAKRCGHLAGKRVVSTEEMCGRLRAALDARPANLLVIARTDARQPEGFTAAVDRGLAYAAAGADVVFVEALESVDEVRELPNLLTHPLMVNVLPDGRTPLLPAGELSQLGYALIVPGLLDLMTVAGALQQLYGRLRYSGDVVSAATTRGTLADLLRLTATSH